MELKMHFLLLVVLLFSSAISADHKEIALAFTEHVLSGMNHLSKEVQLQTIEVFSIEIVHFRTSFNNRCQDED